MRKIYLLLILPLFIACQNDDLNQVEIIENMKKVADYELANPSVHYSIDDEYNYPNGWIPATFYVSLVPLYEATNDYKYIDEVKKWGSQSEWECAPRFRHADDIICGQIYLDLYRFEKEASYVTPLIERMDSLMATRIPGKEEWSWCDALFMSPPVFMMAGSILDDEAYQIYANDMYWDVYNYLFDKEESLFYRDQRFFTKQSPNGTKLFWGRGNGWVLGGLARMIPYIKDEALKAQYVELFTTMSARIVTLQQEDGLWRSNLLDANHFPHKETSGSAFYLYAFAWGVNQNYLDAETYTPSISKGWKALTDCIDQETGMLGWVQPIGAGPGDIKATTTKSYGAGAFVLAGTEIIKMIE